MGLIEQHTDMPHAYVEFYDGTVIAVPLLENENYTRVAKVHITAGDGKTVKVSHLSVQRHPTPAVAVSQPDRIPALAGK